MARSVVKKGNIGFGDCGYIAVLFSDCGRRGSLWGEESLEEYSEFCVAWESAVKV